MRASLRSIGWRFIAFTLVTIGFSVAVTLLGADWFFAGFAYGMVVMHIVHIASSAAAASSGAAP